MEDYKMEIKILKYFLRHCPPGELQLMLTDVKALVSPHLLQTPEVQKAIRDHMEKHCYNYLIEENANCLVTPKNREISEETEESLYFSPEHRKIFQVELISQLASVLTETDEAEATQVEEIRRELIKELEAYIKVKFKPEVTGLFVYASDKENHYLFDIYISSINTNFQNSWVGNWLSIWKAKVDKTTAQIEILGDVHIYAHYYEDGNVHFKLDKKIEAETIKSDINPTQLAKSISKQIQKIEDTFQNSLDDFYDQISDEFLKKMRRKMPVTGVKFNWEEKLF